MKKQIVMLAVALSLLLARCQAEEPAGTASVPPEPSPTAGVPVSTPLETPSPEQLLAQQPIDDTHDAFLVETGGKLGTLLVTVEKGERGPNPDPEWEPWEYPLHFFVWDPADMSQPIQKLEGTVWDMCWDVGDGYEELDANFDGYMDFSWVCSWGNGASSAYLWVWNEGTEQFVEVPEYREISFPRFNPETGIIDGWARNSGAGDGVTTFHRWEDGELVCIRRIETWWEATDMVIPETEETVFVYGITVEDRIGGELTQVYYKEFPPGEDFFDEQAKWEHLDYHGEN